jgi:UDP-N-acetylmuramoyl-L-alanyl-D-glutamate--2,6-diaminopimelate ligase
MTMVGVTGTNGKTSTVQLLAQALAAARHALAYRHAGRRPSGAVEPTGFTTPLVQMHALLAQLRDAGRARWRWKSPRMRSTRAAWTACTRRGGVHQPHPRPPRLPRHMASYGAAKARLFAWPGPAAAVINLDDAFGRQLFAGLPAGVQARLSSLAPPTPRVRRGAAAGRRGLAFELASTASAAVRSPLLGRFNVDNLLAVAGTLHAPVCRCRRIAVLSALHPVPAA